MVAVLPHWTHWVPEEKQPSFIKAHFQNGVSGWTFSMHLVYEVNVSKAVSDKVDVDIEDRLRRTRASPTST